MRVHLGSLFWPASRHPLESTPEGTPPRDLFAAMWSLPAFYEQIGQTRSVATHEAEEQNVGGELSADERIGQARSFATHEAALSEEQKNVARESVKKDAVALRRAKIMIKVDEIFDDVRRPMVEKVRQIREG